VWKKKIKEAAKSLKNAIESKEEAKVLAEKLTILQKVCDKAAKEKVIHKNRANRLKSTYAHKIAGLSKSTAKAKHHK
jgi:ribosomal protein S20